jgi:hypothetical protein
VDPRCPTAPPPALPLISYGAALRSVFRESYLYGLRRKVNGYSDTYGICALVMLLLQSELGGDEGQAAPCSAFFE